MYDVLPLAGYGKRRRCPSCPGSDSVPIYSPTIKDGALELNQTGSYSMSDYIESFRDSTDIAVILSRYAAGDDSALSRKQGFYGDASLIPSDFAELHQLYANLQAQFTRLPEDYRKKYNGDFSLWLSEFGSSDWLRLVNERFSAPDSSADLKPEVSPEVPPVVIPSKEGASD